MDEGHLEMPEGAKHNGFDTGSQRTATASATRLLPLKDMFITRAEVFKADNGYVIISGGQVKVAPTFDDAIEIMARWMGERG